LKHEAFNGPPERRANNESQSDETVDRSVVNGGKSGCLTFVLTSSHNEADRDRGSSCKNDGGHAAILC